jgi:hypothetical protein
MSVGGSSPTFQELSPFPSSRGVCNFAHVEPTGKAGSPRRFYELQAVVWRLLRHTTHFAFRRDAFRQAVTRHLGVGAVADQFDATATAHVVSCQSPMVTCNLLLLTCRATPEPPDSSPRNWCNHCSRDVTHIVDRYVFPRQRAADTSTQLTSNSRQRQQQI